MGGRYAGPGRRVGRRWGEAVLAALLTCVLVVCTVAVFVLLGGRSRLLEWLPTGPSPTPALAGAIGQSPQGAYWGVFLPRADQDQAAVATFASDVGRQPAIVSMYQQWWGEPAFPAVAARWLERRGIVPLVVWEPWRPDLQGAQRADQPAYRLSAIAHGGFDPYVRRYADQVRAYGGPLFLEPFHEMNGNWYPWGGTVNGNSAADYVAAWQHLHDLFWQEGATNVTWTWTPNGETVPDTAANQPERYWPGAVYVDWVGLDAYNWGASTRTRWRSVAQIFGPDVAALRQFGKPIMLAETACTEKGGDKPAWITSLFAMVTGELRDAVGAVVWFDGPYPGFDWRTDTSPASQAAFAAAVARPGVLSAGQVVAGSS